jgi:hypothetical protein
VRDGVLFGQSMSVVVQFLPASPVRVVRLSNTVRYIGNYSFAHAM